MSRQVVFGGDNRPIMQDAAEDGDVVGAMMEIVSEEGDGDEPLIDRLR